MHPFNRLKKALLRSKAAAQSDAPNYRPAEEAGKACGTCINFTPTPEGDLGHCKAYDFTCKASYVCDAWAPKQ
jgi:hypothetical protein